MSNKSPTDFKLAPTISAFAQDRTRWRLLMGPVGSSKTTGVYLTLLAQATEQPLYNGLRRSRVIVVRNTRAMIKDSIVKTMLSITPADGVNVIYKEADFLMVVRLACPDGTIAEIEFLFRALEDEADTRRLLSTETTWVWVSEFSEVPLAVAKAAASRAGRYPSMAHGGCTHYGLVAESNFPVKGSDWHTFMELEKPDNVRVFKQPSALSAEAENLENLPPTYYQDMLKGADPRWIASYIKCEYPDSLTGTVVHQAFSLERHAGRGLKPIDIGEHSPPVLIGLDCGRTPAAVICQQQGDGRLNILDELTSENMSMQTFATQKLIPLLRRRYAGMRTVAVIDPAGSAMGQAVDVSPVQVLQSHGLVVVPASTNNIADRLAAVDALLLMNNGLLIDAERCPLLTAALARDYIYAQTRRGQRSDIPEKKHPVSDLVDAAQYICLYINSGLPALVARRLNRPRAQPPRPVDRRAWT